MILNPITYKAKEAKILKNTPKNTCIIMPGC